jgi:signal transduction histidine kinase
MGTALAGAGIIATLAYLSSVNYLLFHSIVEVFSVVIAFAIFLVVWNSRAFLHNNYLLFLGIAFPFIGSIDFLHMLSYSGMGVFEGYGVNPPTQLWIQARYLEAFTFLLAPLFFRRKVRERLVLAVYMAVTGLLLFSVFGLEIFPVCYAEPAGLTQFKKISEYIISLILIISLVLVVRRQGLISRTMFRYLAASILTTIGSELAFTFYVDVFGLLNMLGHLLKILSFYFIYKGVLQECLRDPYSSLFLDLKRSEEALRKAEKELQVKNRELEAFIHTAAHDLRSPLSSIGGYAQLLAKHVEKKDLSKMEMMTDHIRSGVKQLDRLLNDLLDFAFVGRKAAEPDSVNIADVIQKIVEEKREQISNVGAEIVLAEGLPTLHMTRTEAYQLFANLISNSLKFSRNGVAPRIEVKPGKAAEEGFGTVNVTDNGIGIASADLEKIFDLFVALDNVRDDGTGAGLAIVRRIVEFYEGSIDVDSTPGEGTTFILTLPVI